MTTDRSARTLIAAFLILAAVFVAMNRAVVSAPLVDWWLPIVLAIAGIAVALAPTRTRTQVDTFPPLEVAPRVREYLPPAASLPASPETASLPQSAESASVMSPASPETAQEPAVAVDEAGGAVSAATSDVPTTPETPATPVPVEPVPASPQTPVGTVEAEAIEEVPISPETPAAQPGAEAVPASPETAAADTDVTLVQPIAPPSAQEPSHMARTEHAPEEQIAEREAPPAPPVKEGEPETALRTEPEEQVVLESTADAPQPYETAQHGEITPDAAARVAEGQGETTHIAANLTEPAPADVQAQEVAGKGTAGKPDDLTRIDGIGEKLASVLRAAGIDSFQKLANASDTQLQDILQSAKVRVRGNSATWAQQAAYAAQGDWEGFNRYNHERKARGED